MGSTARSWVGRCAALVAPAAVAGALAGCAGQPSQRELLAEEAPPPPAALSRLDAPVAYDFAGLLPLLERVVPSQLGGGDSAHVPGLDKRYAYDAERGPLSAFIDGDLLHIRTTVSYSARGYYKPIVGPTVSAGCGADPASRPRLVVELATPLALTPDWHLSARTRVVRVEPASVRPRDRCNVSILQLDVTGKVAAAARKVLSAHLGDIDRTVATLDLPDCVAGWWQTLARPIQLADGLWLLMDPQGVRMGRLEGRGHVLTVPVSVDARPRIVSAAAAPAAEPPPLPPLGRAEGAEGFRVLVDAVVDYATASGALTRALAGKSVREAGRTIVIEGVSMAPADRGRLELWIAFSGDAHGALRFLGRPVLDAAGREIEMPDLDYDLHTNDRLLRAYAWLRSGALRASFREQAHVPVAPALERARALLLDGMNREIGETIDLRATVDSLAVRAVYPTAAGLIVRAEAGGSAAVAVRARTAAAGDPPGSPTCPLASP